MVDRDGLHLRVGHAERDEVAERLRIAAGEGRLDLDELDQRLEAAHAARTRGDLVRLTVDLPGSDVVPTDTPATPARGHDLLPADALVLRAVMGECGRRGPWRVPAYVRARSVVGTVTLDLREAELGPRTEIVASAVLGDVRIVVNSRTRVVLDGKGVMGDFKEALATVPSDLRPDSPVVVVTGRAVMGSVSVKRRGMPGELRRRFLGV